MEERKERFLEIMEQNEQLIRKVCFMYSRDEEHFKDLYQEAVANLWQGMESFRGEAKLSTWVYRTCINSCVTFFRRNNRYDGNRTSLDGMLEPEADTTDRTSQLKMMYEMISQLSDINKAIILMWLDERSYDEISAVTGLTRNNVASRLRRIKLYLSKQADY